MKNLKKNIALLSAMALAGTMLAGCNSDTTDTTADNGDTTTTKAADNGGNAAETQAAPATEDGGGKVLKIYAWNDEFKSRFEEFYGDAVGDVKVEWVITPNEGGAYQDKLDTDLLAQDSADEPIDLFMFEADYALKYVNSDYSLDVTSLGITSADTANMYQYTKDICTDGTGALKGLSWQCCPGLYIYKRSIATEVFGTDDQAEIQKKVADWDTFNATAAELKAAGYYMLSGYDDSYRTFSNNMSAPWVDSNKKIVIDDNLMKWVDQTKDFTDNGYNEKTSLWGDSWSAGMTAAGKVFGYFMPGWGIDFVMAGKDCDGDWCATEGPQGYFWGGSWLAAAKGTDNAALVGDIMKKLTCDTETLVTITEKFGDCTNNKPAMEEIAASDYANAYLGGQNHIALFSASAGNIDMKNSSAYDQDLNESFQGAFVDYFNGTVDKETALENFYTAALERCPGLSR